MTHLWLPPRPLVLASSSLTRKYLLEAAGLQVDILVPDVNERSVEAETSPCSPIDLACMLALAKARVGMVSADDRIIVAADQILACDGEVFHKSLSLDTARLQLSRLSNKAHLLHSAAAIVFPGCEPEIVHDSARLIMRDLSPEAINTYLDITGHDHVTGTVGGYRLEGLGIHLFRQIEGAHATILGLPLTAVLHSLRTHGCLAF